MKIFLDETKTLICNDYLNGVAIDTICSKYAFDSSVLYRLLRERNIKYGKKERHLRKMTNIMELYNSGKSGAEISKLLHVSRNDILAFVYSNKEQIINNRPKRLHVKNTNEYYTLNENIFSEMDTFTKNQFLGLFYADGCITKNTNRISITLKEDDKSYLVKMNNYLECTKPVGLMKKASERFFSKDNKSYKTKNAYGICIESVKMKNDLIKWGIEYNKSYTDFSIPSIPKEFLNAFVLGYFEGDGTIAHSKIKNRKTIGHIFSILCQPKFAVELRENFQQELGIDARIYTKKANPNLRTIQITKISDLIKLYHWLYDSAEIVMERKHDKFLYILNFFANRSYEVGELRKFE